MKKLKLNIKAINILDDNQKAKVLGGNCTCGCDVQDTSGRAHCDKDPDSDTDCDCVAPLDGNG